MSGGTNDGKIRLEAASLSIAESARIICPECGGGSTKEKSLSITRTEMGLLYNCHRNRCGIRGFISSLGVPSPSRTSLRHKSNPYTKETRELSPSTKAFLQGKYGLFDHELKDWREIDGNRTLTPVTDIRGYTLGKVSKGYRDFAPFSGPKTINYIENDSVPWLHFPSSIIYDGPMWLVEDIISSIKASRYVNCVCIFGTHISQDIVSYLQHIGVREITLALDEDATAKAVRWKEKLSIFFRNFIVQPLSKDVKDMTTEEMEQLFGIQDTLNNSKQ